MTQYLAYIRAHGVKTFIQELLGSLAIIAIIGAIVFLALNFMHLKLLAAGWVENKWHSAGIWYCVGLACAFFWPIRYYKGMDGHWGQAWVQAPILALTGPFAILLGFPL